MVAELLDSRLSANLQVKQGELCFIKEFLVLHLLGEFPAELLLSLQGQVEVELALWEY